MHVPKAKTSRRQLLLGSMALGLCGAVRPALANSPVGSAMMVEGEVSLRRGSLEAALQVGDAINLHDFVVTRKDGLALLMLERDMRINLGGETEFAVDEFVVGQSGTIQLGGAMVFDRPEGLPPVDLVIQTAFAQIGVRGTRFFAGPSQGRFAVFVDRGTVSVAAAGTERVLGPGDGVDFANPGDPPGDVVQWGAPRIAEAFASLGLVR